MAQAFDIVVAGAGPVGLAFAASLAGTGLRIALVDPQAEAALADPADDGREIALTDHSVAMLAALGAWAKIPASQIAPLRPSGSPALCVDCDGRALVFVKDDVPSHKVTHEHSMSDPWLPGRTGHT